MGDKMRNNIRLILVIALGLTALSFTTKKADRTNLSSSEILLSQVHQVIKDGVRSGEGYFNSDGSLLVYQSEKIKSNPFYQIFIKDLLTGEERIVSTGTGKTTCGWIHPGNEKVLFSSTHEDPEAIKKQNDEIERRKSGEKQKYSWDYDNHYDIYERPINGGFDLVNLTNSWGYDAEASWSHDGSKIIFASNRSGFTDELSDEDKEMFKQNPSYLIELYMMNADGSNVQKLTNHKGYDGGPFFNSDSTMITWRRFDKTGRTAEIMVMDVNLKTGETSEPRQLTNLNKLSWAPYFHPSGKYIVFASNKHGHRNFELFIVDLKGEKDPVRVTNTEGFDGLPVYSPNGKKLSWVSQRTENSSTQVFMSDWNHGKALKLLGLK